MRLCIIRHFYSPKGDLYCGEKRYSSASNSTKLSGRVAQLVAKRMTVCASSSSSQNPKDTRFASSSICPFSTTTNCWLVGVS